MLESQKLVGSGPVQPVRWLRLCMRGKRKIFIEDDTECFEVLRKLDFCASHVDLLNLLFRWFRLLSGSEENCLCLVRIQSKIVDGEPFLDCMQARFCYLHLDPVIGRWYHDVQLSVIWLGAFGTWIDVSPYNLSLPYQLFCLETSFLLQRVSVILELTTPLPFEAVSRNNNNCNINNNL